MTLSPLEIKKKIKIQLTLRGPELLLLYIPSLQLNVFWVSDILLLYLKRFSQLHHISPLIKYMWKSMALDHCILSLKCFSCLLNDVVNQKIIKNHLYCNLPFSPPNPISLSLQGALWFVSLPHWDNAGISPQVGTLHGWAEHLASPVLSWTQLWLRNSYLWVTAYFFLTVAISMEAAGDICSADLWAGCVSTSL